MTKLPREELEKIIQHDLPGYRLSEKSTDSEDYESTDSSTSWDVSQQAEASTPNLQSLRVKYLHNKYLGSDSPQVNAEEHNEDEGYESNSLANADLDNSPEDEIIAVQPEASSHPWDRSARPKAAVISGKEKKVIGQQG